MAYSPSNEYNNNAHNFTERSDNLKIKKKKQFCIFK